MSRFSMSEAEARGWVFVHYKPAEEITRGETFGRSQFNPPSLRAEKYAASGKLISEEAESLGLLLERIYAYEEFQDRITPSPAVPAPLESEAIPVEFIPGDSGGQPTDIPIRTVTTSEGTMTEEEWASRDKADAVYSDQGTIFHGPHDVAVEAEAAKQEIARNAEDAAKAEPDVGPTKQLIYDTADTIDSPGQSAGGTLTVHEGESSLAEASVRSDQEAADAESERVNASIAAAAANKAESEAQGETASESESSPAEGEVAEGAGEPVQGDPED